jgi:hypothetical protein
MKGDDMERSGMLLTRRELLQGTSLVAVTAALSWPVVALGRCHAATDACGDWQLDDICNSYPPYSFRIVAPDRREWALASAMPSADWHWIG